MTTILTNSAPDDLLDGVDGRQRSHAESKSAESQKRIGQFFTPAPVARFMASLLTVPPRRLRLLDPGAIAPVASVFRMPK